MGLNVFVKFQIAPLKFHTKFWTHRLQDMHFTDFYFCAWFTIFLNCKVISHSEMGPWFSGWVMAVVCSYKLWTSSRWTFIFTQFGISCWMFFTCCNFIFCMYFYRFQHEYVTQHFLSPLMSVIIIFLIIMPSSLHRYLCRYRYYCIGICVGGCIGLTMFS